MSVLSYVTSTELPVGPVVQVWLGLSSALFRLSLVSVLAHMSRAVYGCSQLEQSEPEMDTLVKVKGGMSDPGSWRDGGCGDKEVRFRWEGMDLVHL